MSDDTKVTYLDPVRVTATRQTEPPRNRSRTGYGSKLPSSWLVQLDHKRWHRVYVVCWSNVGSAYVVEAGARLFLGSYDPGDRPPVAACRVYATTFCNRGHRTSDGKPVDHECCVLPPAAIAAERAGKFERASELIDRARRGGELRTCVGVRIAYAKGRS